MSVLLCMSNLMKLIIISVATANNIGVWLMGMTVLNDSNIWGVVYGCG